eukprot:15239327-Alexandrium_andersonii.AAC.1
MHACAHALACGRPCACARARACVSARVYACVLARARVRACACAPYDPRHGHENARTAPNALMHIKSGPGFQGGAQSSAQPR